MTHKERKYYLCKAWKLEFFSIDFPKSKDLWTGLAQVIRSSRSYHIDLRIYATYDLFHMAYLNLFNLVGGFNPSEKY